MKRFIIITLIVLTVFSSSCGKVLQDEANISQNNQEATNQDVTNDSNSNIANEKDSSVDKTDTDSSSDPKLPDLPPEPEIKNKTIKIVAAGDNLLHNTISFDAKQSDGSYDFSSIYARIAHITSNADLSFINQEIMLTGKISGYPRMEAPAEVADALIGAGFNIINLASNHTLDKGEDGLEACISNVKQRDFDAVLGVYETEEQSQKPILVEKDGIIFGFLSFTYDMNGYTLSEGNEWKVDLINEAKMKKDLNNIRPLCDYLIVSMHWGVEYQSTPSDYQKKLASLLCNNGADLIIGTHPHVLQPLETILSSDGSHQTICAWSLGNFISNQHKLPTMLGGMLQAEIEFDEENNVVSVKSSIIPTVTHYDDDAKNYEVYLLGEYSEDLASTHGIRMHASEPLSMQFLNDLAQKVLGDAVADEIY